MDKRNDREDIMNTRNSRPQKAKVQSILPGTDPLPTVNLAEAGNLLAEGKVRDAVFRIFALAGSRINRDAVIDMTYYAAIWEHITIVREVEFPPEEERKLRAFCSCARTVSFPML